MPDHESHMRRQEAGAGLVWHLSLWSQAKEDGLREGRRSKGWPGGQWGTMAPTIEAGQAGPRYRKTCDPKRDPPRKAHGGVVTTETMKLA